MERLILLSAKSNYIVTMREHNSERSLLPSEVFLNRIESATKKPIYTLLQLPKHSKILATLRARYGIKDKANIL